MIGARRFRRAIRRRVIVHLVEGYSLDGVLGGIYADGLELGSASYVRVDEEYDTPLDGVQIIPWHAVSWIQELNGAEPIGSSATNAKRP